MSDSPAAMQVLRQEHANMTVLLHLMEGQLAGVRQDGVADFALMESIVDYFLTYPDLVHHPKEDLLFYRLREVDPAAAAQAEELLSGHDSLGLLARRVARAMVDHILQNSAETRLWLTSLGQDFVDINRRHMAQEEKHFFPLVLRTLSDEDWEAVDRRMGERGDPLFGTMVEDRFQSLHQYLARHHGSAAPQG